MRGAKKAREDLDKLVYGLIKERRKRPEYDIKSYDDLLTRLLQTQDTTTESMPKEGSKSTSTSSTGATSPPSGMSDRQVRDEVMTILLQVTKQLLTHSRGHSIFYLKIPILRKSFYTS